MIERPDAEARLRILRFAMVGAAAALLLFLLSWLFVSLGAPPFAGSVAAYAIAFAVAYLAQRGWTFSGAHSHGRALPRYFAVQLGCALGSGAVAHAAVEGLGFSAILMSAVVTVAASAMSFVLSALWVFPDRARRES